MLLRLIRKSPRQTPGAGRRACAARGAGADLCRPRLAAVHDRADAHPPYLEWCDVIGRRPERAAPQSVGILLRAAGLTEQLGLRAGQRGSALGSAESRCLPSSRRAASMSSRPDQSPRERRWVRAGSVATTSMPRAAKTEGNGSLPTPKAEPRCRAQA